MTQNDQHSTKGATALEQASEATARTEALMLRFLVSGAITSILAGMVLDGGEVSKPSIIGTWIVSAAVFGIVVSRRGKSGTTALDRLVIVLTPPVVFVLFMTFLPLVWRWRGWI